VALLQKLGGQSVQVAGIERPAVRSAGLPSRWRASSGGGSSGSGWRLGGLAVALLRMLGQLSMLGWLSR
jgi:hypothetical protein